jgi:pimeloyl-ACP methyl ester carboxylesterase
MQIPAELASFAHTTTLEGLPTGLFYYDAGPRSAPALLLLHGLGDEADTWRRVIGPLSRSYRVLAPDIPGFGRSPLPRRRLFSPPFLGSVILGLLDSLEIDRAGFVGSSLGASILQYVATLRPAACSRLVLIDGGLAATSRIPPSMVPLLVPGLGERGYRGLELDPAAAFASLRPYYAALDRLPADQQDFLRQRVGERVASGTQRRAFFSLFRGHVYWMLLHGARLRRTVESWEVPTTYIWGAEDHIIPITAAREMSARQPGARFVVIDGAGHLPQQESPDELLRIIAG